MPAMPNLLISRFMTFGERNAGSVGPKMKAYGYAPTMTEPEIVDYLFKRYEQLTAASS